MSSVSILVTTALNPNLIRAKLLPLVELPEVREVIAVQDTVGPRIPRVHYVALGSKRLGRFLHALLRLVVLSAQVARRRPSIVLGIYMMPHGLMAYLLGRVTGRRVYIWVIGGQSEVLDGGYWIDQFPVRRPGLERLYLEVLRRADVVVVTGTKTARYLTSHGVDADRIRLISAKVDVRRFRPTSAVRRDYDLIFAGRLVALKRVDLFLRIVADLRAQHPCVRAAILGDGPLRGDLEQLADRLGVGMHVDWLGFHENTESYYSRSKVFVLTSTTEGLSLAMLEAMACGLPVVAPAIGDLADVVREGVTGYLVPSRDQAGFVRALSGLLDDDARRQQLGDNARSAVLRGYSIEDGARTWHSVIRSAFSQSQ